MHAASSNDKDTRPQFVSTGSLPTPEQVEALVREAYARYKADSQGEVSQVYPALARVPHDLFGICIISSRGNVLSLIHI